MSRSANPARPRMTADQLQAYLSRRPEAATPALAQALGRLGVTVSGGPALVSGTASPAEAARPPRRGVETGPIIASLKGAVTSASASTGPGPAVLSLWFSGARVLSVNELFSVLQYRRHETFRYKKAWRSLVARALKGIAPDVRGALWFSGPTRLTLFRRGRRLLDLDSLATVFKYATDTLRREGIIDDDNPAVIVEPCLIQTSGPPALGMRLEALPDWSAPKNQGVYEEWFAQDEPLPVPDGNPKTRRARKNA